MFMLYFFKFASHKAHLNHYQLNIYMFEMQGIKKFGVLAH